MTWVKICGITNLQDAKEAAFLGADALGFIFATSKRKVDPQKVKEIVASLPREIEKIGVFLDNGADEVREIADFCGLTGLQFHGSETPQYCKKFSDFWIIKAFRVNAHRGWDEILPYVKNNAVHRVLLDTYVEGVPGGTGKAFPWKLATAKKLVNIPVIVAGGITPLNVLSAIKEASPFGIDVSSGVEKEPGVKDVEKLKSLIQHVKEFKGDIEKSSLYGRSAF